MQLNEIRFTFVSQYRMLDYFYSSLIYRHIDFCTWNATSSSSSYTRTDRRIQNDIIMEIHHCYPIVCNATPLSIQIHDIDDLVWCLLVLLRAGLHAMPLLSIFPLYSSAKIGIFISKMARFRCKFSRMLALKQCGRKGK